MFFLNNKNFVVAPEWTITQWHRNTPNIFLSRLSIKMGFSMCMHQMKRAEVSGWKHYKKVLFKKSLKGVADWVLWDLVEKDVAIKGPTTKTESVDFPTSLREPCCTHPHFAFSLLPRGSLGIWFSFLPGSTELALCVVLSSSWEEVRPPALHPLCLPLSEQSLGPHGALAAPVATVLSMFFRNLCLNTYKVFIVCQLLGRIAVKHSLR